MRAPKAVQVQWVKHLLIFFLASITPKLGVASEIPNGAGSMITSPWKSLSYSGSKFYVKATLSVQETIHENNNTVLTEVKTHFLSARKANKVLSRYDGATLSESSVRLGKKPKYRETLFFGDRIVHTVRKPENGQENSDSRRWSRVSESVLNIPESYRDANLYSPESIFLLVREHIKSVGDKFTYIVPNKNDFIEISLRADKLISVEKNVEIEGSGFVYKPKDHLVILVQASNITGDKTESKFLNCDGPLTLFKELSYNLITEITCVIKPIGKITLNLDKFVPKNRSRTF